MTPRENFHRMMKGEGYSHVPFDLPLTPPMVDELERRFNTRDAGEAYRVDFRYAWPAGPRSEEAWRTAYSRLGITLPANAMVSQTGFVEIPSQAADVGKAYHLTDMVHPLAGVTSVDQLLTLPWHDLEDPRWTAPLHDQIALIQAQGFVATLSLECTVFESAWYLRSMEVLYEDLFDENPVGAWLLDRFTERSVRYASAFAAAGGDFIRLGDDIGTQRGMMMSIGFWREHLQPRLEQVIRGAKRSGGVLIQYHSDGDISSVVDDLIEIGVDVINPVQPECMDIDEVAPRWMDRLGFSGLIGTQTTMPFGNTDDVRAAVAKCERWIQKGAKMILAPTHVLEPDVPWENVEALVDAVAAIRPPQTALAR